MSFRAPELLFLLALIPALIALALYTQRRRERSEADFGDRALVSKLIDGRSEPLRAARLTFTLIGLTLLIFALAGPRVGGREETIHKSGLDLVVALDFSKSMWAEDIAPSRIERAKAELSAFLGQLAGDRVGIVAFAGETMEFPMTTDYSALELFLKDLSPADMPVGGTAIARALLASKRLLERGARDESSAAKVILLVTDGEDHEVDPRSVLDEIKEAGIHIFAIGIGSERGEPIPLGARGRPGRSYLRDRRGEVVLTKLSPAAEVVLKELTSATGGEYLRASGGTAGFREIRRALDRLERDLSESRRIVLHEERFVYLLLPALLFLFFARLLPERIGRTRVQATGDNAKAKRTSLEVKR